MDRNLWFRLYTAVMTTAYPGPATGVRHPDRVIAAAYLWAAAHRRPTGWGCDPAHWDRWARRPGRLPSQPTMSRRLRSAPVGRLFAALVRRFRGGPRADWVKYLDAYPLAVGNYSHDPDATTGYGAGGYVRGYKLHAAWGAAPAPLAFEVRPAHQAEPCIARVLVRRLGGAGYLVGDASHDSNPLHRTAAGRHHQVVAPPKKRGRGLGHHRQEPGRLRSRALLAGVFGRALYATRSAIERWFSRLEGVGLGRLPGWVRRPWRVKRWVQAHLLILAAQATAGQPLLAG
jgi:hypothetical protein